MFDWKEMVPIQRLLLHVPSRKFICPDGRWTENPDETSDFPDLTSVAEFCARRGLRDVELVLKGEHEMFKIRLPTLCMLVN